MEKRKRVIHIIKHTKRYVLCFWSWYCEYTDKNHTDRMKKSHTQVTYDETDSKEEIEELKKLYDNLYKDTPRPRKIPRDWMKGTAEYIDYLDGTAKYWGYAIIDFEDKKILGVYHDKLYEWSNWKNDLGLLDRLFGEESDIPEDYEWDDGEWEGWLQYKWGNELNAIEKEDEINRKKEEKARLEKERKAKEKAEEYKLVKEYEESEAERLQESFDRELDDTMRKEMMDKYGW